MLKVPGGCAFPCEVSLDLDPNPQGLPYVLMIVRREAREVVALLDKDAVEKLAAELQRFASQM